MNWREQMQKIKVKNKECPLCGSMDTESYAVYNGTKYTIQTSCNNPKCIGNNLDTHPPISSGKWKAY